MLFFFQGSPPPPPSNKQKTTPDMRPCVCVCVQISPDKFLPVENGETAKKEEFVEEVVDVPREIEVEEIVEKEVLKDVVETRKIPQVKAMYAYKGQGMKVEKGEVGDLFLCDSVSSCRPACLFMCSCYAWRVFWTRQLEREIQV